MNLFYLDEDHRKNAEYHVNAHSHKMLLESMQLVCTTFHLQDIDAPYKPSHKNHPSSFWTRQSRENFQWVIDYASSLSDEYTHRYGKVHKSTAVLQWAIQNMHRLVFPRQGFTEFALAMPDEYKTSCPIISYRNYYRDGKSHLHAWKNRDKPEWL